MPNNFEQLNRFFTDNEFDKIEAQENGVRFLKLRSISRKNTIEELCTLHGIPIEGKNANALFKDAFLNLAITSEHIDHYINQKYEEERTERRQNETYLIDQLNRLHSFDWGGSKGNSLEKNIVDNYVKKIQSYDRINEEIEGSLLNSLRGYTLNSWYNHWTSILIEDIFKDNQNILPTVGLIKKVDFFIQDIPLRKEPPMHIIQQRKECHVRFDASVGVHSQSLGHRHVGNPATASIAHTLFKIAV